MQAGKLVPLYELGDKKEAEIYSAVGSIRRHLHQCDDVARRVLDEIDLGDSEIKAHLETREEEAPLRLPAVSNLTNDIETFLYHAKLVLRDTKRLFPAILDKQFRETTQYSHIADWSSRRFEDDNPLTKWVRSNLGWIQKLIDSRNAIEHPEQHSLEVRNFHVDGGTIRDPSWSLNGEEFKSIRIDLGVIPNNLLEFVEILLIYSLANVKSIYPIVIAEIPEPRRDSAVPVRFIATLEQDLDENGLYKGGN